MSRRVFSEIKARKALKIAREVYGDAARVTVNPDGSITIERSQDERSKRRVVVPEKDFVL